MAYKYKRKKYSNKKKKFLNKYRIRRFCALTILFIIVLFIWCFISKIKDEKITLKKDNIIITNGLGIKKRKLMKEKQTKYEKCLEDTEPLKNDIITNKEQEIIDYINNNNLKVSILYDDINTSYSFGYNENKIYYGCSLIKLVDTLYLFEKINDGSITFDTKLKYNSKNYMSGNPCMNKFKPGSKVTVGNVIECALTLSDNIAHEIMLDYIGFDNLQTYGKSLGAKSILNGGDHYGYQSASDMIIYLKHLNELVNKYPETGSKIINWMKNDYFNYLLFNNSVIVAHKYGNYDVNYHDVGIVYGDNPYYIAIMTEMGYKDYESITKELSKRIYELHELYYTEKQNKCYYEVYGIKK